MPRKVFTAGEILTAADVNTNLMDQAVMTFGGTGARGSAIPMPIEGMVTYLQDSNILSIYDGNAWRNSLAPNDGILQVVTATDNVARSTGSGSYVDAGISITVTPKIASSTLYVYHYANAEATIGAQFTASADGQITDSGNTALVGAENVRFENIADPSGTTRNQIVPYVALGVVASANTTARTYKARFKANSGTAIFRNTSATGRMVVIEVAG